MAERAQVVVIGAGIVGCSVAFHLAQRGWSDILVVDKGAIFENDGSTSHAPGNMHLTNPSKMMTEFAMYTRELIALLPQDPANPFYRPTGGIEVAATPERLEDLKRRQGWATSWGVEAHLISPDEVKERIPLVDARTILGGYWVPGDTNIHAWRVARALGEAAAASGSVRFLGECAVDDLVVEKGAVRALLTGKGRIDCEYAILCTNIWSPLLGDKVGVPIPLLAAQHQYAITEPLPELAGATAEVTHPILRHQDAALYFRQHGDRYGIGNYQHVPLMVAPRDLGKTAMLSFTPEHFGDGWRDAVELIPALAEISLTRAFNGMFAFSIDGYPIIGESPQTRGFWVATASWITHSGGVGQALANLMTDGDAGSDIREAELERFLPHQTTAAYIWARCSTNYDEVYDIIHPAQQMASPRNVRLAPWHRQMRKADAHFFASAGWEIPQWYGQNAALLEEYGDRIPQRTGWAAEQWSPIQGAEHLATRERAGLFSIAGLAVIEVRGRNVATWLNSLCANQMDRAIGSIVYTSLLTPGGGIVCDLTVVRLAEESFWVITGGGLLQHDLAWLRKHLPADGSIALIDFSGKYLPIGLWGPRSRAILQSMVDQEISNECFPFYTAQSLTAGTIPLRALRISYAGELGYELYASAEYGAELFKAVRKAGKTHGLALAGGGAFDSLRLEKGYRLWGSDMHTEYNPLEAGLGWTVRWEKEFIGREALERIRSEGITRKLCCMTLDEPGAVALGKEPIFANGKKVGYVTSANYGYSVGAYIVYGYLPIELAVEGTQVEVEYFGVRHPATVRHEPLFDPKSERMKT